MTLRIFRLSLLFYVPILLVSLIALYLQYESKLDDHKALENRSATYRANLLSDMQQRIVYNVDFWSRIRYPDNFSPLAKDSTFMNPYLDIMKGISDYYQFRYIDSTGQELLRIERDGKTQKLVEGKLQNKAYKGR